MQKVINDVYKDVATKYNKDYSLVKSVGDGVFSSLQEQIKLPSTLISKLRGIGFFYLRKKKLGDYIEGYKNYFTNPEYPSAIEAKERDLEHFEKRLRQYNNLCERFEEYKKYSEKKQRINQIRYLTQPLIEPKNDNEY